MSSARRMTARTSLSSKISASGVAALAQKAADSLQSMRQIVFRPVEIRAADREELVHWVSQRRGRSVAVLDLTASGYRSMGDVSSRRRMGWQRSSCTTTTAARRPISAVGEHIISGVYCYSPCTGLEPGLSQQLLGFFQGEFRVIGHYDRQQFGSYLREAKRLRLPAFIVRAIRVHGRKARTTQRRMPSDRARLG